MNRIDASRMTRKRVEPQAEIRTAGPSRAKARELDSPPEGDGFELSVPREMGHRFELSLLFMSLKPSAF